MEINQNSYDKLFLGFEVLKKLRFVTFVILIFICILDKFIYPYKYLGGMYIIVMILAGLTIYKLSYQIIVSIIVAIPRFTFSPYSIPSSWYVMLQALAYFCISFTISNLICLYIKTKRSNINLILALAKALDSRDRYTCSHSINVAKYAKQIAEAMNYPERMCNLIYQGGLLHDIGKIGVSDSILKKPFKLSEEEFDIIKKHPQIGHSLLQDIEDLNNSEILEMILYHHERFDGKGYPMGLKGEEIPKYVSIICVADAFDAIISRRVYRKEKDIKYALIEIGKNSGTQFDPEIVETFLRLGDSLQVKNDN